MTAAERRAERKANPPLAMITLTVMLGLIMAIIDASIVNVALNDMAGNLGSSVDEIGWVATGYILANVIIMPLNGWLTARFGRRNFYAACVAIFTIASVLCGTAHNVWQLVFYRVIQGLGGGALQPTAQAIMFESYPPEKRANAMAIFGLGAMVGPAIGPTLGGVIVDNYSWPLIFYINIPIGIVAFVMTLAFIRDPVYLKRDRSPIDYIGLGLLTAGVASVQYVLERGQREDWFSSPTIVILTAVAVVSLTVFCFKEWYDPRPLVDLKVFNSRAFSAGSIIGVITGFGLFGTALILPLFLQNVLGFSATETGMALLPGAVATAVSMPVASRLAGRLDGRAMIAFGLVLFAFSAWWMGGINQDSGYWNVFWPRAVQGFALGFIFVPLTTATLGEIVRERMANATGIYTLVRQLGGSLGIAILQFLQTRYQDNAYATLASGVTQANPNVSTFLRDLHGTAAQLYAMVMLNATVISYDMVLRLCGIIFVLSAPLVMLLAAHKSGTPGEPAAPIAE
ncbi:MAG: transporter, family, multidrug resistance protein [Candidatus Eremiobacteraeota bacterium]|jgi:DHA2 family multidrug resistance protein|nr:transporter, family, multidrug resistance protein [Candidatus Eremiobacteraeota bacterium]